eukprot:14994058-Alexandrium_andersonii.AAC.1
MMRAAGQWSLAPQGTPAWCSGLQHMTTLQSCKLTLHHSATCPAARPGPQATMTAIMLASQHTDYTHTALQCNACGSQTGTHARRTLHRVGLPRATPSHGRGSQYD